jgi:hypothetical protein
MTTTAERAEKKVESSGRAQLAIWLLRIGSGGGALFAALAAAATFATSSATMRVALTLVPAGFALLWVGVAVGVWRLARWALWTAAILAILFLAVPLLLEVAKVQMEAGVVETTAVSQQLAWAQFGAAVLFLTGLALLPRKPRR